MASELRTGVVSLERATVGATPAAGTRLLYPRSDGWYELTSAGVESKIGPPAQLATAVANTSANTVYPDAASYWRRVTTTDGFPFTGMLTGNRSGTAHTQRLQDEVTANTYARVWANGTSSWTAWAQYLDAADFTAAGQVITSTAAAAFTVIPYTSAVATFSRAGALAVLTGTMRWPVPFTAVVQDVRAMVGTAPTGAAAIFDVRRNGTTIFTTTANRPTVAAAANASSTTAPDVTVLAAGDYLTSDIAQIGSTVAGSDLVLNVTLRRTA